MTRDHDDAGEHELAGIDLHAWRVPPPAAVDRHSLVMRALSPAAAPARRPRFGWIMAAIVLLNAAVATIIVIALVRPPPEPAVIVEPAGGSVDSQVHDVLQRLEQEQRELEGKLAEIQELRALVVELSDKVRHYEEQDATCDRTVPKPPDRPRQDRQLVDPYDDSRPTDLGSCDEVSCVLQNYEGSCCEKFRRPRAPTGAKHPSTPELPDALDRQMIVNGIASVKAQVAACGGHDGTRTVKVRVHVNPSGVVTSVVVDATPDTRLADCVEVAVTRAVFARTKRGGSFGYPFVF